MAAEASNLGDRMTEPIRAGEQQLPKIEEPVDQVSLVRVVLFIESGGSTAG